MLPFDNKSEFQVIIDMPEGTPLDETARARGSGGYWARAARSDEFSDLRRHGSPYNFNGLVRHYYLRVRLMLRIFRRTCDSIERKTSSHEIAKAVRNRILPLARRLNANVKVSEAPPGPPVLQTLVAEVYGPEDRPTELLPRNQAHFRIDRRRGGYRLVCGG